MMGGRRSAISSPGQIGNNEQQSIEEEKILGTEND
jgi:hypothetical protein